MLKLKKETIDELQWIAKGGISSYTPTVVTEYYCKLDDILKITPKEERQRIINENGYACDFYVKNFMN